MLEQGYSHGGGNASERGDNKVHKNCPPGQGQWVTLEKVEISCKDLWDTEAFRSSFIMKTTYDISHMFWDKSTTSRIHLASQNGAHVSSSSGGNMVDEQQTTLMSCKLPLSTFRRIIPNFSKLVQR